MMINDPDAFNAKAHEWAVMHAGAPKNVKYQVVKPKPRSSASQQAVDDSRYAPSNLGTGLSRRTAHHSPRFDGLTA